MNRFISIAALSVCLSSPAADSWPQFRGPNASGIAQGRPPVEFGPEKNLAYKVPVDPGIASPCIWDDQIILATFKDSKLAVASHSRTDGSQQWRTEIPAAEIEKFMAGEGSPAASTPATDGKRIFAYFGSCGMTALDMNGKIVWQSVMPPAQHVGDFGSGASPIVHEGMVYLLRDVARGSQLYCFDAASGEIKWKADRSDFSSGYSTPVIRGDEVITSGFLRLKAYNKRNGAEAWEVAGLPAAVCTTPVLGPDLVYFAGYAPSKNEISFPAFTELVSKGDKNKDGKLSRSETEGIVKILFAIWDLNGDGLLDKDEFESRNEKMAKGENICMAVKVIGDAEPQVVWKQTKGLPYVPSPLFYQGNLFFVKDGGLASSYDGQTGAPQYEQERIGALGNYYASPVAADGKIYTASVNGVVTVLKAGGKLEVLARNDLGEKISATPAIVGDALYVRSAGHLWCFKESKALSRKTTSRPASFLFQTP